MDKKRERESSEWDRRDCHASCGHSFHEALEAFFKTLISKDSGIWGYKLDTYLNACQSTLFENYVPNCISCQLRLVLLFLLSCWVFASAPRKKGKNQNSFFGTKNPRRGRESKKIIQLNEKKVKTIWDLGLRDY